MKNKKLVILTTIVLLLTLIVVSQVSNTFAKYTSKITGSDTAIVAKWDVSDGDALANFDIFGVSKIYDANGVADFTQDGVVDNDVATGTTTGIIAPGTWGKFSFTLSNNSDVNALYTVDYTVDEAGVYLQWSTDGKTWTDDLADVSETAINMGNNDETIDIYWMWSFENGSNGQTDESDTSLGTADTLAKPTITVDVTFTQVN